jgi:hypothetical protein
MTESHFVILLQSGEPMNRIQLMPEDSRTPTPHGVLQTVKWSLKNFVKNLK